MAKEELNTSLKRLRNRYRLIVMNEDTYEEVVKFKLSRLSVYAILSSVFILLSIFTVALIVFTPIKYYLPGVGYGNAKQIRDYKMLKIKTDSIELSLSQQQRYIEDLQKVLQGKIKSLDTSSLKLPQEKNKNTY
jgi:hypothetical protein